MGCMGEYFFVGLNLSRKTGGILKFGQDLAIKTKKVRKMLKRVQKNLEVKKKCVSLQSV